MCAPAGAAPGAAGRLYEMLIDMYRELSPEQGEAANTALILLLENHNGDHAVLSEAMAIARAEGIKFPVRSS